MELDILHLLKTKELYDRFYDRIGEHTLSPEAYLVFKNIGEYYKFKPEATDFEWADMQPHFFHFGTGKHLTPSNQKIYVNLFNRLRKHEVSTETSDAILSEFITKDYATKIHNTTLDIISNKDVDIEDVQQYMDNMKVELQSVTSVDHVEGLVTTDIHELIRVTMTGPGLNWRIKALNECVGPLRKGNFVIVGARPDSGKTTFLLSEVTNFASQLPDDECILWINNEEVGEKVFRRLIQSAIGWTDQETRDDPLGCTERLKAVMGSPDKIKHVKRSLFTVRDVEKLVKKFKPKAIVFDQLWKVVGFEKETNNEIGRQTLLFAWARGLGQEYGPVITVHQLGGEAEGVKWPTMKNLYGSQTGIQGEADLIILIGRSHDPAEQDYRFFSLPKNKLGDGLTIPNRNARFVLKIRQDIGRFEDASFVTT
jgi:hypothetical protein